MGAVMGSGSNVRRRYFPSEDTQIRALTAMTYLAEKKFGLEKGVAFVLVQPVDYDFGEVRFKVVNKTLVRPPRYDGSGDKGTNYFGVAMGKLAMMMATDQNSFAMGGNIPVGEMPYRGGLMRHEGSHRIFIGFSGGTEDQDTEIAIMGMEMLMGKKVD